MPKTAAARRFQMDIFATNPQNIWNYQQDHPELVAKDCKTNGFGGVYA